MNSVAQAHGLVKWIDTAIFGFKNEGWFLLETVPCPPKEQLSLVIADIINDNYVGISQGKVIHDPECQCANHNIDDPVICSVINEIEERPFKVAICTGTNQLLQGQPIAIVIEPQINYMVFPDHPHLNTGGTLMNKVKKEAFFLPESICYGYNKDVFGLTEYDKYLNVIDEVTIWLFRHQIWELTRKKTGNGIWIGRGEGVIPQELFPTFLNPNGNCRCGSKLKYKHCHYTKDLRMDFLSKGRIALNQIDLEVKKKLNDINKSFWKYEFQIPHQSRLKRIEELFFN
jgi:hypothetical protein